MENIWEQIRMFTCMRITGLDTKNTPGYIQYADWDKSPFQWHFGRALQKTGIFYRSFNFKVFSRNFFPVTFFHRFYLIITQLKLHDPSRNKIKNDLLSLTKRLTFSKKIFFQISENDPSLYMRTTSKILLCDLNSLMCANGHPSNRFYVQDGHVQVSIRGQSRF